MKSNFTRYSLLVAYSALSLTNTAFAGDKITLSPNFTTQDVCQVTQDLGTAEKNFSCGLLDNVRVIADRDQTLSVSSIRLTGENLSVRFKSIARCKNIKANGKKQITQDVTIPEINTPEIRVPEIKEVRAPGFLGGGVIVPYSAARTIPATTTPARFIPGEVLQDKIDISETLCVQTEKEIQVSLPPVMLGELSKEGDQFSFVFESTFSKWLVGQIKTKIQAELTQAPAPAGFGLNYETPFAKLMGQDAIGTFNQEVTSMASMPSENDALTSVMALVQEALKAPLVMTAEIEAKDFGATKAIVQPGENGTLVFDLQQ